MRYGALDFYYSNKGADLSKRLQIPIASIMDNDDYLPMIEKTADMTFDSEKIRKQVEEDFATALGNNGSDSFKEGRT